MFLIYTVSKNELIKWNGLTIVKIFIFYAESDQATIPLIYYGQNYWIIFSIV